MFTSIVQNTPRKSKDIVKGIMLLSFGAPSSIEDVENFLIRLMRGRKPSSEQVERVKDRYLLIGGLSPLLKITENQAKALERRINQRGYLLKCYIGMLYGHPLIEEGFKKMVEDGVSEVIAIPMTPLRSQYTTEAYKKELMRVRDNLKKDLRVSFLEGWHKHPIFLDAVKEKILEGLEYFSGEERKRVYILFSAHSLPKSAMKDDPYLRDLKEMIQAVLKGIEAYQWSLAFQSRAGSEEEWLGPDVENVLGILSKMGIDRVLIVPIGFVTDHIEILYDIDILYKKKAESLGISLMRSPLLNTSDKFIDALFDIVEKHLIEDNNLE